MQSLLVFVGVLFLVEPALGTSLLWPICVCKDHQECDRGCRVKACGASSSCKGAQCNDITQRCEELPGNDPCSGRCSVGNVCLSHDGRPYCDAYDKAEECDAACLTPGKACTTEYNGVFLCADLCTATEACTPAEFCHTDPKGTPLCVHTKRACDASTFCAFNTTCINGACFESPEDCNLLACPEGSTCSRSQTNPYQGSCVSDACGVGGCKAGQTCTNGVCTDIRSAWSCDKVDTGVCTPSVPCSAPCEEWEACKEGVCTAVCSPMCAVHLECVSLGGGSACKNIECGVEDGCPAGTQCDAKRNCAALDVPDPCIGSRCSGGCLVHDDKAHCSYKTLLECSASPCSGKEACTQYNGVYLCKDVCTSKNEACSLNEVCATHPNDGERMCVSVLESCNAKQHCPFGSTCATEGVCFTTGDDCKALNCPVGSLCTADTDKAIGMCMSIECGLLEDASPCKLGYYCNSRGFVCSPYMTPWQCDKSKTTQCTPVFPCNCNSNEACDAATGLCSPLCVPACDVNEVCTLSGKLTQCVAAQCGVEDGCPAGTQCDAKNKCAALIIPDPCIGSRCSGGCLVHDDKAHCSYKTLLECSASPCSGKEACTQYNGVYLCKDVCTSKNEACSLNEVCATHPNNGERMCVSVLESCDAKQHCRFGSTCATEGVCVATGDDCKALNCRDGSLCTADSKDVYVGRCLASKCSSNCDLGFYCDGGLCAEMDDDWECDKAEDGLCTPYTPCTDCADNEECENGECVPVCTPACAAHQTCLAEGCVTAKCGETSGCLGGAQCNDMTGLCEVLAGKNPCSVHMCPSGACFVHKDEAHCSYKTLLECSASPCSGNQACTQYNGVYLCKDVCTSKNEACSLNEVCATHPNDAKAGALCVSVLRSCDKEVFCAFGSTCSSEGVCFEGTEDDCDTLRCMTGSTCTPDTEDDFIGRCVSVVCGGTGICSPGLACSNDRCTAMGPWECDKSIDGTCTPYKACVPSCKDGFECNAGLCVAVPTCSPRCESGEQCNKELKCERAAPQACGSAIRCSAGEECSPETLQCEPSKVSCPICKSGHTCLIVNLESICAQSTEKDCSDDCVTGSKCLQWAGLWYCSDNCNGAPCAVGSTCRSVNNVDTCIEDGLYCGDTTICEFGFRCTDSACTPTTEDCDFLNCPSGTECVQSTNPYEGYCKAIPCNGTTCAFGELCYAPAWVCTPLRVDYVCNKQEERLDKDSPCKPTSPRCALCKIGDDCVGGICLASRAECDETKACTPGTECNTVTKTCLPLPAGVYDPCLTTVCGTATPTCLSYGGVAHCGATSEHACEQRCALSGGSCLQDGGAYFCQKSCSSGGLLAEICQLWETCYNGKCVNLSDRCDKETPCVFGSDCIDGVCKRVTGESQDCRDLNCPTGTQCKQNPSKPFQGRCDPVLCMGTLCDPAFRCVDVPSIPTQPIALFGREAQLLADAKVCRLITESYKCDKAEGCTAVNPDCSDLLCTPGTSCLRADGIFECIGAQEDPCASRTPQCEQGCYIVKGTAVCGAVCGLTECTGTAHCEVDSIPKCVDPCASCDAGHTCTRGADGRYACAAPAHICGSAICSNTQRCDGKLGCVDPCQLDPIRCTSGQCVYNAQVGTKECVATNAVKCVGHCESFNTCVINIFNEPTCNDPCGGKCPPDTVCNVKHQTGEPICLQSTCTDSFCPPGHLCSYDFFTGAAQCRNPCDSAECLFGCTVNPTTSQAECTVMTCGATECTRRYDVCVFNEVEESYVCVQESVAACVNCHATEGKLCTYTNSINGKMHCVQHTCELTSLQCHGLGPCKELSVAPYVYCDTDLCRFVDCAEGEVCGYHEETRTAVCVLAANERCLNVPCKDGYGCVVSDFGYGDCTLLCPGGCDEGFICTSKNVDTATCVPSVCAPDGSTCLANQTCSLQGYKAVCTDLCEGDKCDPPAYCRINEKDKVFECFNPCATTGCKPDEICVVNGEKSGCKSICEGFPCAQGLGCRVNATTAQPYCYDLCESCPPGLTCNAKTSADVVTCVSEPTPCGEEECAVDLQTCYNGTTCVATCKSLSCTSPDDKIDSKWYGCLEDYETGEGRCDVLCRPACAEGSTCYASDDAEVGVACFRTKGTTAAPSVAPDTSAPPTTVPPDTPSPPTPSPPTPAPDTPSPPTPSPPTPAPPTPAPPTPSPPTHKSTPWALNFADAVCSVFTAKVRDALSLLLQVLLKGTISDVRFICGSVTVFGNVYTDVATAEQIATDALDMGGLVNEQIAASNDTELQELGAVSQGGYGDSSCQSTAAYQTWLDSHGVCHAVSCAHSFALQVVENVYVCRLAVNFDETDAPDTRQPVPSPTQASQITIIQKTEETGLSEATVIGAIIGAIAGMLLICLAIYCCVKRRRRLNARKLDQAEMEMSGRSNNNGAEPYGL